MLFGSQLENYQKPTNNDTHGYDGPIAISNGGQITGLAHDFLRASDAIGVPFNDDIQGDYIPLCDYNKRS